MSENGAVIRKQHFIDNWLTWVALHHFLSAPMMRELVYVMVDQMSAGSLSFDDLFEESLSNQPDCLSSWLLQPIEQDSRLGEYLQQRIRAFVWKNDSGNLAIHETGIASGAISPSVVEQIVEFGACDFRVSNAVLYNIKIDAQSSFTVFMRAFKKAQELFALTNSEVLTELEPLIDDIELPLSAVAVKHLGDLYADADCWEKAGALYERAAHLLSTDKVTAWDELTSSLKAIFDQSLATAARILKGTEQSSDLLEKALEGSTLQTAPLLLANASFDALVAASQVATKELSGKKLPPDLRSSLLLPPLLSGSQSTSNAIQSWLSGKFDDSHRRFRAVLRRQIALGFSTESCSTKALFARSIFDKIEQHSDRQISHQLFYMGLCLLIESEDSDAVASIRWNEKFVESYVDQQCVGFIITHAKAHFGSQLGREMVTVNLFLKWLELIEVDSGDIAKSMLSFIAKLALEAPLSINTNINLGGCTLDALHCFGTKRPELRRLVVSEVADVVLARIQNSEFWTGREKALEIALVYADVFPEDSLRSIVKSTLSILDNKISTENVMWPVVRPALNFLVSSPVRSFAGKETDLGEKIISTILHFGCKLESERSNVIFYLANFDSALFSDSSVQGSLRDIIVHVRHQALQTNASNVIGKIQALLIAPVIAGREGIEDAIKGLTCILRSGVDSRPSIALPSAYEPLLTLANDQQKIADEISVSLEEFQLWLKPLIEDINNLWGVAKEQPLVFATFSLPPATKPDSVVVHNWTFASLRFAQSIQQDEEIESAISAAEDQPMLSSAIALARATCEVGKEDCNVDVDSIQTETRDTFYSILGRRLVILQRLGGGGHDLCKALLDQCFRQGPQELDAAVFLAAHHLNLTGYSHLNYSDYMQRVSVSRGLRLTLMPILELFEGIEKY